MIAGDGGQKGFLIVNVRRKREGRCLSGQAELNNVACLILWHLYDR